MDFDKRADELFLDFPEPPKEEGLTVAAASAGKLVFLSGAYPLKDGRMSYKGRVGLEINTDTAKLAAHAACMQALGSLREFLGGSLNQVRRIVNLRGFVASGVEFHDHHKVLDGASQLLVDLFGAKAGKHSRTVVGVTSLPYNAAVELELVVEIK